MERFGLSVCLLLIFVGVVVGQTKGARTQPKPDSDKRIWATEVCELTQHGAKFNGRRVSVSAAVVGTFEHGFALIAPGCKIGPVIDTEESDGYMALLTAIKAEGGWTDGRSITAEFTGVFHYYPKSDRPKWILRVERISNVEMKQKGTPNPQSEKTPTTQ